MPRATYYLAEFFRGREKIFATRTLRPRLTLPAQWTFQGRRHRLARGRYRWRVRAFFGPKSKPTSAKLVVSANLQVGSRRG